MNYIKTLLFKIYLLYENKFPINRGKFSLSKLITKLLGKVSIKTPNGIWLSIIPSSSMDRSYLLKKNDSHMTVIREICKLEKGDVFVDIGANIGYYSFTAASIVGDKGLVYSFEPSHREYIRLLHGLALNNANNVLPFNCALADHNGVMRFHVDEYHTGLNRLQERQEVRATMVPVFKADYIINAQLIALVKIDVEGAEFQVLKGLQLKLEKKEILKLIVEITPSFLLKYNSSKSELYDFMNENHYKPIVNSEEWQYDEIFILNEVD